MGIATETKPGENLTDKIFYQWEIPNLCYYYRVAVCKFYSIEDFIVLIPNVSIEWLVFNC